MSRLVIVESPGKIGKIGKILGNDYLVDASVGHVMDMPQKGGLQVDIKNGFKPNYILTSNGRKNINRLKGKLAGGIDEIILATDLDREGEMIAWSLLEKLKPTKYSRIVFDQITKSSILKAIEKPGDINWSLVEAQKARRVLDRIVGFKLSPLIWKLTGDYTLSAGRVQSVVVKLVAEREAEIDKYIQNLKNGQIVGKNMLHGKFKIPLLGENNHVQSKMELPDAPDNMNLEERSQIMLPYLVNPDVEWYIDEIDTRSSHQSPPKPFTTSSLCSSASYSLGLSTKSTMKIAQTLYERGFITYMRTDSMNLSGEIVEQISKYLDKIKLPFKAQSYQAKGKTMEAHEAIRPCQIEHPKAETLSGPEDKLYWMIHRRTVQSQMPSSEWMDNRFIIYPVHKNLMNNHCDKIEFNVSIPVLISHGYLALDTKMSKVSTHPSGKLELSSNRSILTELEITNQLPPIPNRYTESSLITKLSPKNLNIGRPSTYGSIMNVITKRGYVVQDSHPGWKHEIQKFTIVPGNSQVQCKYEKVNLAKASKVLIPSGLGLQIINYLESGFANIMDYKFTAYMEQRLDQVASGNLTYLGLMTPFYQEFSQTLQDAPNPVEKRNDTGVNIGDNYILKCNRYGNFVVNTDTNWKCGIPKDLSSKTYISKLNSEHFNFWENNYPKVLGIYKGSEIKLCLGGYGFYLNHQTQGIISLAGEFGKSLQISYLLTNKIPYTDVDDDIKIVIENRLPQGNWTITIKNIQVKFELLNGPYGKYFKISDDSKKILNVKMPKDLQLTDSNLESLYLKNKRGSKPKNKR